MCALPAFSVAVICACISPHPPWVPSPSTVEDELGLCEHNEVTTVVLVLRSQLLSQRELCACHLHLSSNISTAPLGGFMAPERDGQPIRPSLTLQLTRLAGFCCLGPSKVFILLKDLLSPLGPQLAVSHFICVNTSAAAASSPPRLPQPPSSLFLSYTANIT